MDLSRSGMDRCTCREHGNTALPFKLNRSSITRWINVSGYLESVRRQLADKLHWYLLAAGTEPSISGNRIRQTLMAPVLATAGLGSPLMLCRNI